MKEFFTYLALALTVLIGSIILLAIALKPAKAAEPVQDFVQCTYKPSPSDALTTHCGSLKGKGYLAIRLCGVNYTVDINCD